MPRLPNALIHGARHIHPYLPLLLRPCRTLEFARYELRWLKEAAGASPTSTPATNGRSVKVGARTCSPRTLPRHNTLKHLCRQRGRGVPLQYLLGTEFFGDLELRVKRGVLVPRQDTAAAVIHLAHQVEGHLASSSPRQVARDPSPDPSLRVLDLCTGTGCMSLLFAYELSKRRPGLPVKVLGVDVSARAVSLVKDNARRVVRTHKGMEAHSFEYVQADVLALETFKQKGIPSVAQVLHDRGEKAWDVVLANPPYVSETEYFSALTERSVRCFEPKLALVPEPASDTSLVSHDKGRRAYPEDRFFRAILDISSAVHARVLTMEIGSTDQATRIARLAQCMSGKDNRPPHVEIWRDDPSAGDRETIAGPADKTPIEVIGSGNARTVFVR